MKYKDQKDQIGLFASKNRDFYNAHALSWDQSRQSKWDGWLHVAEKLLMSTNTSISVLDLGCGNGRFLSFLRSIQQDFIYAGADISRSLLAIARKEYPENIFQELDITDLNELHNFLQHQGKKYSLITLLAIAHHIPDPQHLAKILKTTDKFVEPGGAIVISFWQFISEPRIQKKLKEIDATSQLYELDWKNDWNNSRRLKLYSKNEIAELAVALQEMNYNIDSFEADGKSGKLNYYLLAEKKK